MAFNVTTGVGKTEFGIDEIAKWRREAEVKGPVLYVVPTIVLADEVADKFTAHGVNARVFRGREAIDPKSDEHKMCLDLKNVREATLMRLEISSACCKTEEDVCLHYGGCGYYRQQEDYNGVEVWVAASNYLFHPIKAFGEPILVIIDEAFWQKGVRGLDDGNNDNTPSAISLQSLMPREDELEQSVLALRAEAKKRNGRKPRGIIISTASCTSIGLRTRTNT